MADARAFAPVVFFNQLAAKGVAETTGAKRQ